VPHVSSLHEEDHHFGDVGCVVSDSFQIPGDEYQPQ